MSDYLAAYNRLLDENVMLIAENNRLRVALERVLESFTQKATIGEAVVRTGWWYPRQLDEVRAALHPEVPRADLGVEGES